MSINYNRYYYLLHPASAVWSTVFRYLMVYGEIINIILSPTQNDKKKNNILLKRMLIFDLKAYIVTNSRRFFSYCSLSLFSRKKNEINMYTAEPSRIPNTHCTLNYGDCCSSRNSFHTPFYEPIKCTLNGHQ